MQIRDVMTTPVITIGPEENASAAWKRMRRRGIRHLVVADDARLVGVISERDLGGRGGDERRKNRTVQQLMTPNVETAHPDMPLDRAADLMRERLIGSLPVVDADRFVGIATATDVFEALGQDAMGALSGAERQLLRSPSSSGRLGGSPIARARSDQMHGMRGTRPRRSNMEKREAFADLVPRVSKRDAGRTLAPEVPSSIRTTDVALDESEREYIRKRLGEKLGKFATSIERVTVRLHDINGPRGGIDQSCTIKVVLSGLPSVVFESRAAEPAIAINRAVTGVERAVRRLVQRRRMVPLKREGGRSHEINFPKPEQT